MKRFLISMVLLTGVIVALNAQIASPGVKWSDAYTFDRCNLFKIEFFASDGKLMQSANFRVWYNSGGNDGKGNGLETLATPGGYPVPKHNFMVLMDAANKGSDLETIFDMPAGTAIQIFGSDAAEPMYNAGQFKFPEGENLKKLELAPTEETRTITGRACKKYTYTFKKITGTVWIAPDVNLPNDYGIFRAAKMAALHNTLSVPGFVMEMTTEDSRGGKTVMTTLVLESSESTTVNLPKGKVGTAMNKANWFSF